jgi:naphthalene 1,2-dioxygenase system ferredoxin subunit
MSQDHWIEAMSVDALPTDDVIGVEVAGRDIAIYRVGAEFYATDNICTHAEARLCDGFLIGHEIECPLHQARFDVRDGRPTCEPAEEPLRSYPVKVEGQRVWLRLD